MRLPALTKLYNEAATLCERLFQEHTAAPKDVGFLTRRLKEAEAEHRLMLRRLESVKVSPWEGYKEPGRREQEIARYERLAAEYKERADYYRAEIEALGGVQFSPETIKKGDVIFRIKDREAWNVVRVNKLSVTARATIGGMEFEFKIPYPEIRHVVKAGDGN